MEREEIIDFNAADDQLPLLAEAIRQAPVVEDTNRYILVEL